MFLWGSSQLIGSSLSPASILEETAVESHSDSYLFLMAIKFIHRMKTGPFYEHSSLLHQISQLPSWAKANGGLVKMYDEEVLNKYPIVQHLLFGRVMQFRKLDDGEELVIAPALKEQQEKTRLAEAKRAAAPTLAPDAPAAAASSDAAASPPSEETKQGGETQ